MSEIKSKLFNIALELSELDAELKILNRLRYKLSSQMRHYKEFNKLRQIIKKTTKFTLKTNELSKYEIKDVYQINVEVENHLCMEIKAFLQSEGHLLENFLARGYLLQFTVIAFSGCAKLYELVDRIHKKIIAVERIQKEKLQKKKKEKEGIKEQSEIQKKQ